MNKEKNEGDEISTLIWDNLKTSSDESGDNT
jgi:hypothetical protein